MHNVILIFVSSSKFNSLFRRFIEKFLVSFAHLSFPGYQVSTLSCREAPFNHCKDWPCVFNFSFFSFDHPFVYRSSSWRFHMMVHQGFNSFSKCSLRFFSEEFEHSSSCNPECNFFFRIIGGGIMSFLII